MAKSPGSDDRDPLERLRMRMKRMNERPASSVVSSSLKQAVAKKTGGLGGKAKGNSSTSSNRGGWVSIGSGKAVKDSGQYSRNVVVKVRYVNFTSSPSSKSGSASVGKTRTGNAGGKSYQSSTKSNGTSSGYGSAKQSTMAHINYAKERPSKSKEVGDNGPEKVNEGLSYSSADSPEREQRKEGVEYVAGQPERKAGIHDHGELYDAKSDGLSGKEFVDRTSEDTRQFRLIISPEDGGQVNLKSVTRQLVSKMENDLGTKLDWVAANHYNTDNPHTHLIVRGHRDDGSELVIKPDYIQRGIRNRTREILDRY